MVERAADVLAEHGLAARMDDEDLEAGVAILTTASLDQGFELADEKLAVISEADVLRAQRPGTTRASRASSPVAAATSSTRCSSKTGDFVVHQTHGIGKFLELVQREVSSRRPQPRSRRMREYLVIEYAPNKRGYPGDKLYVPTDQLDLLTRYVGGEAPALSKMGGSDWAAAKGRARRAVRDIAVELVKLYSARMASKGHAFGADTPWQRELEEAFAFAETPRPARHDRRGEGRHGAADPDGPPAQRATSATGRPRSPCAPPSRRSRTASRSR